MFVREIEDLVRKRTRLSNFKHTNMKALRFLLGVVAATLLMNSNAIAQLPIVVNDDYITVNTNVATDISMIFYNDDYNDSLYFINSSFDYNVTPNHGTFTWCPPNNVCVVGTQYMSNPGYIGMDTFTYIAFVSPGRRANDKLH